jgi:hypothetical protein
VWEGIAKIEKLVKEALALFAVEFQGIRDGHGLGAAVLAGQTAGLGHLPVDKHGISRKIALWKLLSHAAHGWSGARDNHDAPFRLTRKNPNKQELA